MRLGVPFRPGELFEAAEIGVFQDGSDSFQSQCKVLARWPDQSIRWCLIEFVAEPTVTTHVGISSQNDTIRIKDVGVSGAMLEPLIGDDGGIVLRQRMLGIQRCLPVVLRHDGKRFHGLVRNLECIDRGPIRWSWQGRIEFSADGVHSPLVGEILIESYSNFPIVELEVVIRNPQPMEHPGGNWDLGAPGNVLIEELSVSLQTPAVSETGTQTFKLDIFEDLPKTAHSKLQVFQASSGGQNWQSRNHVDRHGQIPMRFSGYHVLADGQESRGSRAEPYLQAHDSSTRYGIMYRDFWQNFPKALTADRQGLQIGLFPPESGYSHELQGGEQKTHRFAIEIAGAQDPPSNDWYRRPVVASLAPNDYAEHHALPHLDSPSEQNNEVYESLVDAAIEGGDTFASKAEKIDQYGWRNFGDLYGDHEAVFHDGDEPLISHYNNQYDCTLGFAIQFMRRSDVRWWDLMCQMADHAWDIDSYHTELDKLLYNGGLFWHTYHYAEADTSTHRSYPKRLRCSQSFDGGQDLSALGETGQKLAKNYAIGGGPAASHNYNTGWMVAYWLTGCDRYRRAAISAADYVLRIDDGSRTPCRWLSRSDTGYSTCSADGYYGPGRGAANSTHALITGHELTGDERYLARAFVLMRRTVHPREDIEKLNLLNAELRWFYTMYLQSLGRLIDFLRQWDRDDDDYRYAVATLLHYANWMAQHECPTLSKPEELQYPTETWAAQDMRKWHVLAHAARYESDPERRQTMQLKAEFFYHDVCESLKRFPTRTLCRPIILMLNFGWQREQLISAATTTLHQPSGNDRFPNRRVFVPQRQQAIARLKWFVLTTGVVVALSICGGFVWWMRSK